jgi:hypothetical protein
MHNTAQVRYLYKNALINGVHEMIGQ